MNAKSIFKKLTCPKCRTWEADHSGKNRSACPKCNADRNLSDKWHVRITRSGKTSIKAVSSRRQDAVDYLISAKDAIRKNQLLPGEEEKIPWERAKKAFENELDSGTIGEGTKAFYKDHLRHLDKWFAGTALQDITVRQVEQFRDDRMKSAAPKTVAESIKTLKRIITLHCRWYSARTSPGLHAVASDLSSVGMPKYQNKRTRFLSQDEITLLIEKATVPHLCLAIKIALGTGLRLSNIMGLEWKQIDFINRSITFQGHDMKSRRVFVSPLMSGLAVELVAWRKKQDPISTYVFPSPHDPKSHMDKMRTSWESTIEVCNKEIQKENKGRKDKKSDFSDVVFHTLRHTFASHFLMNGGDLATLSELLDHASIQITKDRYGHLSGEHKRKAIDAFESTMRLQV